MFWADKIAEEIAKTKKPQIVDDAKTHSGRVHVGALRGIIIHDLVHRALKAAKVKSHFTYIIDDIDPMDGLPVYLPKAKYEKYMGVPLKNIPAPEGSGSYSDYFAAEFIKVFNRLGADPEILYSSKLYEKISGSRRPKDFIPFQPICEKCGKIGTSVASSWDGKFVSYECSDEKVSWAKGCGYKR